jgi:phosphoglucosamine mutase
MSDGGNKRKLFGTDGIRGIANRELTPELALRAGQAVVQVLRTDGEQPFVIVGRDTRLSGDMLASAIIAGVLSAGGKAADVGVVPTPAVAFLTTALGAQAGITISASHNPMEYNGIKIFRADGFKLDDDLEERIEELIHSMPCAPHPSGDGVGCIQQVPDVTHIYLEHIRSVAGTDLRGMKVVLDCANGAAFRLAPALFEMLGARVSAFHADPDGTNINRDCGSTNIETLAEHVRSEGADVGLAFDGDADRVLCADHRGNIVDGDFVLAIAALHMKERSQLNRNSVVTTVMTNLGFCQAMQERGITVHQTKVGDRYVLEEMVRQGLNLGGEQSGHVIFLDHSTTGDGLLTGAMLLRVMSESGKGLGELSGVMRRLPQVLINVEVREPAKLESAEEVWNEIRSCERELAGRGRILVRSSGTEPLVRVMVEDQTEEEAARLADRVAEKVRRELGKVAT